MERSPEVQKLLDQVRAAMRACPGHEDDPPARVWSGMLAIIERLEAHMAVLEARPAGEVAQVVRQTVTRCLKPLAPAYERRWRWQTAWVVAGAAAVWTVAVWFIATDVALRIDASSSKQWDDWWKASCVSAPPARIETRDGNRYCLIPLPHQP